MNKSTTKKAQTIGQAAAKLADQYFKIYEQLATFMPAGQAASTAEFDIVCKRLVAEFALEDLRARIKEHQQTNERKVRG